MKTKVRCLASLAALVASFALTGCNTVSTSYTQAIGVPTFPPSDPAQIQILHTEPTRPHIKLGEIRAEPANTGVEASKIEAALRTEAAKLGANAVVLVYDGTQTVGAVVTGPYFGRTVTPVEGRIIIGVAIRYQ